MDGEVESILIKITGLNLQGIFNLAVQELKPSILGQANDPGIVERGYKTV